MKALAAKIGEFVDSEPSSFDFEGNFYRVRVHLDVHNQLKKATSIIRGGEREIFAVKYERLPDWCQVCGMMGHEFKEHGDGVHPPSALIFKNLRAPATTAWGTKRRNNRKKEMGQETTKGGSTQDEERDDTDMEDMDSNRKRTSDEVVGQVSPMAGMGLELALVEKNKEGPGEVPPSPPPKQDPKRSRLTQQSEKAANNGASRNQGVKNSEMQERRPPRWRTAEPIESFKLELSGIRQRPDSSRAARNRLKVCPYSTMRS